MDDGIDVRAIDAHSERIRRAHHAKRADGKRVLYSCALLIFQAGMIRGGRHA